MSAVEAEVEEPTWLRRIGDRMGEHLADRRRGVVAGCVALWALLAATTSPRAVTPSPFWAAPIALGAVDGCPEP